MPVPPDIALELSKLYGKPCCRKSTGEFHSFSLGFGEKVFNENKGKLARKGPEFYGEYEIGTYHREWRVLSLGLVVCGGCDLVDSNAEFDESFCKIEFGSVISIFQPNNIDVHVDFDNGLGLDIFSARCYDDEIFHVFSPGHYIGFNPNVGWVLEDLARP